MIRRTRIVVAAAAALSAVAASGEPIDDAFAPFEGAKDIPGAVSAEMHAPSEPYFSCVGYADIAERRPMSLRKQTPDGVANLYSFGMVTDGSTLSHGGAYSTYGEANVSNGWAKLFFVQTRGGNGRAKALRRALDEATRR